MDALHSTLFLYFVIVSLNNPTASGISSFLNKLAVSDYKASIDMKMWHLNLIIWKNFKTEEFLQATGCASSPFWKYT